jgi:hypothetical protein
MDKTIFHDKVYYYKNAIKNFDTVMQYVKELDTYDKVPWENWTASNDKDFIYGATKRFDREEILKLEEPYCTKMLFIYDNIMQSMIDICKDYAIDQHDFDKPELFPVFNIKKYNTGQNMGAHFDQLDGDKTLKYSLVVYLNDDYEGGELSFSIKTFVEAKTMGQWPNPDYEIAKENGTVDFGFKPDAGSIVIFPSYEPYLHTAHLIKNGFKYMIPGHWLYKKE